MRRIVYVLAIVAAVAVLSYGGMLLLFELSGEVVAGNAELAATPELINQDPYGKGWIYKLKPSNPAEFNALLDAKAYEQVLKEEA